MTDSYFKRPELHIIKGNGNKVLEKLEDIDRKVDSLRLVKPFPVSDTSQADSGVITFEQEIEKPDITSLADIVEPIIDNTPIEAEKSVDSPASGVITKEEGHIGFRVINDLPAYDPLKEGGESISNIIIFPVKKIELSFYQRVLRLFKNIIKCIKEF